MTTRLLLMINNLAIGGAERYVLDLAAAMHEAGIETHLLSIGRGNEFREPVSVPLIELGATKMTRDPRMLRPLIKEIREFQPHVIHTHLQYADTLGQIFGRLLGSGSIVTTIHNSVEWPRTRATIQTMIEDAAIRYADYVIAVSERLADYVVEYRGVSRERVRVMPCGVHLDPFLLKGHDRSRIRASLGIDENAVLFTCSAAFRPEKRHDLLLARFSDVRRAASQKVQLLLLGSGGSSRRAVEERIGALGLGSDVRIAGGDRAFVAAALHASDVFVMHSEFEGASVAVVEAMATGLPLLLPNLPHFSQQVRHEREGILFDVAQPQSFLHAAQRLIQDTGERRRLGECGRAHAMSSYGMSGHVARLVELYEVARLRRWPYGLNHTS